MQHNNSFSEDNTQAYFSDPDSSVSKATLIHVDTASTTSSGSLRRVGAIVGLSLFLPGAIAPVLLAPAALARQAQGMTSQPQPNNFPSTNFPPSQIPLSPTLPPQQRALGNSGLVPVDEGYLLGAGDRLRIDFFNVQEFTAEYLVLPNGAVNLPEVGLVSLQGRTLPQATALIRSRFARILTRPKVTVSLLAARPITIAIAGEINRPGGYTIPSNSLPTLSQTIQLAQGYAQTADLRNIEIRRRQANGMDGIYRLNLLALLNQADSRQDVMLRDGDQVYIPATQGIDLQLVRQLSTTNLAGRSDRPLKVAIVGEVNRPGPYTINPVGNSVNINSGLSNTSSVPSVTEAIQVAGGITQLADIRKVEVRRITRSGQVQMATVNFWELLKSGDVLQDFPIQDGDTITIPIAAKLNEKELFDLARGTLSPSQITVNVVGEVERPGAVNLKPNSTLNQAILTAGGFDRNAVKSNVKLIRLNPDGSVINRDVKINLAQGLNEEGNPALRNNDIIVIKKTGLSSFGEALGTVISPISGIFSLFRLLGIR
jgi:polysaccharide biosynthesis/export protein